MADIPQQFQAVLDRLNSAQRAAVEQTEGPVMVVAGPGTGKTQVLAARIANILLKTDTQPQNILALTFTDAAAKNMRQRVVNMIGKAGYSVYITTFHAYCAAILDQYPEYFPIQRGSQAISQLEQFELVEELVTELPLEALKPLNAPLLYVREIISSISQLKREGFSVEKFREVTAAEFSDAVLAELSKTERAKQEKRKQKNEELATVYEQYQQQIRARNRYDFDDMIILVQEALKKEPLLLAEQQERFQYLLVDEYQDTNTAQNSILYTLAAYWEEQANIFVVGDPHQSIYRFQGASLENVYGFLKRYPSATVITLELGYRCPQPIYSAAHRLIQNNQTDQLAESKLLEAVSTQLTSQAQEDPSIPAIRIIQTENQRSELVWVGQQISGLINSGVAAQDIAVLYRKNKDAVELEEVLAKLSIPYQVDGGIDVLETEEVRQFVQLVTLIDQLKTGTEDDSTVFEVLSYEWFPIETLSVLKAVRLASIARCSLLELMQQDCELEDSGQSWYQRYAAAKSQLTEAECAELKQAVGQLLGWGVLDHQTVFTEWFERVLSESGFLDWIMDHSNSLQLLTNIHSVFEVVKQQVDRKHSYKLGDFLNMVATLQEHRLGIPAEAISSQEEAVTLSTVHKAKGREWRYVFVIHMLDGVWGNTKMRQLIKLPDSLLENTDVSSLEKNQDDRRLFYVAATRAQQQLVCTYPAVTVDGTVATEQLPSMFIAEFSDLPAVQPNLAQEQVKKLYLEAPRSLTPPSEEAFFSHLIEDFTLSVTSLNKYLHEPESFVQDVLLRLPKAKLEHMVFGTAVHAALELLFRQIATGASINEHQVLARYQHVLEAEAMTVQDYQRRLEYGNTIIKKYISELQSGQLPQVYQLEQTIGGRSNTILVGDVPISGRLDRLDWIDQDKKLLRVIDYKTGRARSANEIEAKTKTALKSLSDREAQLPEEIRGAYKRQLLFYKLLTDADPQFKPTVVQGVFEFVEPKNEKGSYTAQAFDLKQEDVALLKELVIHVMQEIRSLEFLNLSSQQ